MIVPMKKVSLIVLGSHKHKALKELRKLGLVHVEITQGKGNRLDELKEQVALLEKGIFAVSEKAKKGVQQKPLTQTEAIYVSEKISELSNEQKECTAKVALYTTELDRLKEWGSIDPYELEMLCSKGIEIALYEMPVSEYNKLGQDVKILVLSKTKSTVRFLVIKSGIEGEQQIIDSLSVYKTQLPQMSTDSIKNTVLQLEEKIKETQKKLSDYACCTQGLKQAVEVLNKEIEFETYATGMSDERLSEGSDNSVEIAYLKGYIEQENLDKLQRTAAENSWGLAVQEPTAEDDVPTKLKNNKFVSLIYPLTDFLGTVPGYYEYDISAWFLGFILVFFGIIFGDGGYGLLITAAAAVPILKSLLSKKQIPNAFLLVGLFGLSTILWGTLTCTWFGLSPEQLPEWLKNLSVPVISNVYAQKIWYPFWTEGRAGLTTAQNLQIFCFSLALVQLTVAHIKGAVRNIKTLKALGDIGSILQLIGIFYIVLMLVVNAQVFGFDLVIGTIPIGITAVVFIGVGFVMSFVFANYEGSIVKSILSSLTNIVSVLLGVVNVFSDIVSYIRLWAVGLAGAAISATVNELAGPLLGNFMFMVLAVVLLVFGHGLNMILNVLSVIVHGIRLNTLEFSSHLDMSWSGHKFKPFEE